MYTRSSNFIGLQTIIVSKLSDWELTEKKEK